jgi:hypothetical protein
VSKRRGKDVEETPPEELTVEDRRAKRKRDRARKKAGRDPTSRSPWRRALVIGVPVAIIAVVAVVLVLSNLPTPCISLVPIPNSAGPTPTFPSRTNPMFSTSWCPSASEVYGTAPLLTININGTVVSLPGSIGRNNSYPNNYQCNLPVLTEPASYGFAPNTINILSDWNYEYNLSTFFSIWSESYPNAYVSANSPAQPIIYQQNDILGFTNNGTSTVRLWVDNQPSYQGPLLDISTLDNTVTPYPSCLANLYGTGHTIAITYSNKANPLFRPAAFGSVDATGLADPYADGLLFFGALPHFGFLTPLVQEISKVAFGSIAWLSARGLHR